MPPALSVTSTPALRVIGRQFFVRMIKEARMSGRAVGKAPFAIVAVMSLVLATSSSAGASRVAPTPRPHFLLSDTGAHGGELNLGITSKGSIFLGGWDHIARSDDN